MEDKNTDRGYLGPLPDAAQQEPVLPSENWSDDEDFVPVFGGHTGKGEGDDNYPGSNDIAQHIENPTKGIDDPAKRSGDQDKFGFGYAQLGHDSTQDYDTQHSTSYDTQLSISTRRSDGVQEDACTPGGSHAPIDTSALVRIGDDADKSTSTDTTPEESKNRVLYIKGLSPQVTYHNILEKVRDVGKIYSLNMIKSSIHGFHSTSLGVVMWDWSATRRLALQVEDGLLDRDAYKPEVEFTSDWFDMAVPRKSQCSRVLLVKGNAAVVRQESIVGFLRETMTNLALDEVIVTNDNNPSSPNLAVTEIRFAGYRRQAELAYEKLTSDPRIAQWVSTEFGPDPCDLVPEDDNTHD